MAGNGEHKSPLKFPCDFVIKVVGRNDKAFEKIVFDVVQKHFPAFSKENYKKRLSRDVNFIAFTITVYAESKKQLDECE